MQAGTEEYILHFWFQCPPTKKKRLKALWRKKDTLKHALLTTECCVGISREDSADALEAMRFTFPAGATAVCFKVSRINVLLKSQRG